MWGVFVRIAIAAAALAFVQHHITQILKGSREEEQEHAGPTRNFPKHEAAPEDKNYQPRSRGNDGGGGARGISTWTASAAGATFGASSGVLPGQKVTSSVPVSLNVGANGALVDRRAVALALRMSRRMRPF